MTAPGIIAAMPVVVDDPLLERLRSDFGHAGFRPGQREVIETIVGGRDAVVVMPTGGGKSLCYQLPAVHDGATTVVVSPLIALMKDQVDALTRIGVSALALHSNIPFGEQRDIEHAYAAGNLSLLYVAPERLVRADLRALLSAHRPARIVVDEAHCISEWGHDFRRDYLRIGEVVEQLRPVQVIACTATATPEVRDDITTRLGLDGCRTYVHGFDRPNLHFAVERCRDETAKLLRLDTIVDPGDGRAIVYAGTRARAAALADRLGKRFPTMLYHGSLRPEQRVAAQERFAGGDARVAVTTSAFGMGVDVANVRQVVHVALPGSLEEYYQQAGRAGRDGLPSRCIVLHAPADRRLQEYFIDSAHPEPAAIAAVYVSMHRAGRDPGSWRAVEPVGRVAAGLNDAAGDAARDVLRHHGVVTPQGAVVEHDPARLPVDYQRIRLHRKLGYQRLDRLGTYLKGRSCRHRLILEHFGEVTDGLACGGCDVCTPPGAGDDAGAGAPAVDLLAIRQALSAVARLNGRVGVGKLAGVLHGSRNRAVLSVNGATSLTTFGVLASWREADIIELLRRMLDAGLLTQTAPPYATVSLTADGIAVMRGDEPASITDPRTQHGRAAGHRQGGAGDAAALDGAARASFERLREWRAGVARERSVPAYVVLPDRTLAALAAVPPATAGALLEVPGIGPVKAELYGPALLALLASAAPATEAV